MLFKRLKDEIIKLKDAGRVLMRFNELRKALQLRLSGELTCFTDDELDAAVGLLSGPGMMSVRRWREESLRQYPG